MNLLKPSFNNHRPGEVSGIRGGIQETPAHRRYRGNTAMPGPRCIGVYFLGKSPSCCFPTPRFLNTEVRVSGGSRMILYTIGPGQDSQVVPLAFPVHSLLSIHGADLLPLPTSSENPFSLLEMVIWQLSVEFLAVETAGVYSKLFRFSSLFTCPS